MYRAAGLQQEPADLQSEAGTCQEQETACGKRLGWWLMSKILKLKHELCGLGFGWVVE